MILHRGKMRAAMAGMVGAMRWRKHWGRGDWATVLGEGQEGQGQAEWEAIGRRVHTGRPCGSEVFMALVEGRMGRWCAPDRSAPRKAAELGRTSRKGCPCLILRARSADCPNPAM